MTVCYMRVYNHKNDYEYDLEGNPSDRGQNGGGGDGWLLGGLLDGRGGGRLFLGTFRWWRWRWLWHIWLCCFYLG